MKTHQRYLPKTHPEMPTISQAFLSRLRAIDAALGVRWHVLEHRYVIVETRKGRTWALCLVKRPNGDYMTLDNRIIREIRAADMARKDYLREFDRQEEERLAKIEQQGDDDFEALAKEFAPYIGGRNLSRRGKGLSRPGKPKKTLIGPGMSGKTADKVVLTRPPSKAKVGYGPPPRVHRVS